LVGDDLVVIFRDPAYKGADGCFYKTAAGKRIIEMKPYLDDDRSLFVMLHECAHAILHSGDVFSNDVRSKPSGSMIIGDHDVIPENEQEANRFADFWLAYAKKHQGEYYEQGMKDIEARLWALLDYKN